MRTEPEGRTGEPDHAAARKKVHTSVAEWIVAWIGALIVFGAAGFMLYEALAQPSSPPRLELTVDTIMASGDGYLVQFRARNHGRQTMANLLVEGELRSDTGTLETSEATIDYVPAESSRRGGLMFSNDPREYTFELKGKGYDRP